MRSLHTTLALLLLLYSPTLIAARFDPEPLSMIQTEAGQACTVVPIESTLSIAGNNGFRIERWVVRTCKGLARYEVSYHPPQFFPGRDSPYAVRRIE
jgi:hypothetical protein